ncbi:hypothetical protein B0H34DRAFT_795080 [Crassisporium funariophilum]|nr:hypothetical protein B0H34DRAFT_795080 [Crassisporium funariophilum]
MSSTIYQIGPTWLGFSEIRRLVVFGDSYSSVQVMYSDKAKPSTTHPLGVPFPGFTYNEDELPNWVGHLISKYTPGPRFDPTKSAQDDEYLKSPLLVHDYASGGDTVAGVRRQIQHSFLPGVGTRPAWAPWTTTDSLFVTWVGINDCASSEDPSLTIDKLFSLQEQLYDTGARNFLFIDVPPIHRSPAGKHQFSFIFALFDLFLPVPVNRQDMALETFKAWNAALRLATEKFCSAHTDITALLFSSYEAFERLLDHPEQFGCKTEDVHRRAGTVWMDHIHPTSQVHDHIASSVASFLVGVPPNEHPIPQL